MKIYCSTCDEVQPVQIDDCRDAQTNESFQDIVCKECYLVIASGTDIQRTWVGFTDEEIIKALGGSVGYTRGDQERIALARAIEAKLKEKNT